MLPILALVVTMALAETQTPAWLDDAAIREAFIGKTISGIYGSGEEFSETYREGGALSYAEPEGRFDGRWVIVNSQFCMVYLDMEGGCFRTAAEGHNCNVFYSSEYLAKGATLAQAYIAMASVSGRPSSCKTAPAV